MWAGRISKPSCGQDGVPALALYQPGLVVGFPQEGVGDRAEELGTHLSTTENPFKHTEGSQRWVSLQLVLVKGNNFPTP